MTTLFSSSWKKDRNSFSLPVSPHLNTGFEARNSDSLLWDKVQSFFQFPKKLGCLRLGAEGGREGPTRSVEDQLPGGGGHGVLASPGRRWLGERAQVPQVLSPVSGP